MDKQKFEEIVKQMIEAWKSGSDYIAESHDTYFEYVVPFLDIQNCERIPPGIVTTTTSGRRFMMDKYKAPNGKIVKVGYELSEED